MKFKLGHINLNEIFKASRELSGYKRILKISEYFLNVPYKKGTLIGSREEREILIVDFEGVDCMTFIEYVEALRLSHDLDSFLENLKRIRYNNGILDFTNRRHFFTDWDLVKSVKNVTEEIGETFCRVIPKMLNKKGDNFWIEGIPIKHKVIKYIPSKFMDKLANKLEKIHYCGFYTSKDGLDVTHVGILIKNSDYIILRHASSINNIVIDEPFLKYLQDKDGLIIYKPLFEGTF